MARDLPYRARPFLILGAVVLLVGAFALSLVGSVPPTGDDGTALVPSTLTFTLAGPAMGMVGGAVLGIPLGPPRASAAPPRPRRRRTRVLVLLLTAAVLTAILAVRAGLVGGRPLVAVAAGAVAVAATLVARRIPDRAERAPVATAGRRTEPDHPPRSSASVRRLVVVPGLAGLAGAGLGASLLALGAVGVVGAAAIGGGALLLAAAVPIAASERERAALSALSGFARHDLSPLAAAAETGDTSALDADDSGRLPRYVAHRIPHLDLSLGTGLIGVPGVIVVAAAFLVWRAGPALLLDLVVVAALVLGAVALMLPPALRERRTLRARLRTDDDPAPD